MKIDAKVLAWLTEPEDAGVRYLALKNLTKLSPKSAELKKAQAAAYNNGPIARVLKNMKAEGYWRKEGAGYSPKYFSTVWSLILLAQLGASARDDARVKKACKYYLDHALSSENSIAHNGCPGGTFACLQGNMTTALYDLEYEDERLAKTAQWMARSVIGKVDKYYSMNCGPGFCCGANNKQPCAWGAVKVMLALAKIPLKDQTDDVKAAIKAGAEFLLGVDPLTANYPTTYNPKPNLSWWKFGFPLYYITDVLQLAECLVLNGYGRDSRLKNLIEYIEGKRDESGKWNMEYNYAKKDVGRLW